MYTWKTTIETKVVTCDCQMGIRKDMVCKHHISAITYMGL